MAYLVGIGNYADLDLALASVYGCEVRPAPKTWQVLSYVSKGVAGCTGALVRSLSNGRSIHQPSATPRPDA